MVMFLSVLAVLAGLAGLAQLSQATLGVGLLALACLLAIFARINQATQYHYRAYPPAKVVPAPEATPDKKIWERI